MSADSESTNPATDPRMIEAMSKIDLDKIKQTYYSEIEIENQRAIAELSPLDEFDVYFPPDYEVDEKGRIGKLKSPDYHKTFLRRKVSRKMYWPLETKGAEIMKERDPMKRAKLMDERYNMMAYIYLEDKETHDSISDEDLKRVDWFQFKRILIACNHAFVYGRLPLPRRSGIS